MKFKRNQLRQDVRVETDLMISVRCIASENASKGRAAEATPMMVRMTDLSGGGLAFAAEQQLAVGDTILVNATSSKLTISGVQARILAISQNRISKRYLYHAQFVNIDFEKKEQVVKYVFSRIRELSQR
jgi:c-di-GMP-binding flagellar brake protein YcgR